MIYKIKIIALSLVIGALCFFVAEGIAMIAAPVLEGLIKGCISLGNKIGVVKEWNPLVWMSFLLALVTTISLLFLKYVMPVIILISAITIKESKKGA